MIDFEIANNNTTDGNHQHPFKNCSNKLDTSSSIFFVLGFGVFAVPSRIW